MRRATLILLIALAPIFWAAPASAAETVTLTVQPDPVPYGAVASFAGVVAPAAVTRVTVYRQDGATLEPVVAGDTRPDGSYVLTAVARLPGAYLAQTATAASEPVSVRIGPSLDARLHGLRVLGSPLRLTGRLQPHDAGALTLTVRGATRKLRVRADGRFRARVRSDRAGRVCASLRLAPAAGFVAAGRRRCASITVPTLSIGDRGATVRFLEGRLAKLRYALRGVDRAYQEDTRDAVLAFQKVEGLARDGVTGPQVWRSLRRARTPRPAARGTHIEVDKTRQVLFEVRKGRVVAIMHVSTGATGNTPVGRWRVYLKAPGYNALGMYYSLYFLRGFAIHGYASVPPYPASHGCVRLPLWFAPGLYARWPVGTQVRVLA